MIKIFIFLTLFFADFISKKIISNLINLNEFFFVTFFLDIVHVHNFGISFGLFSGKISSGLLIFIGLIISVVILFMMGCAMPIPVHSKENKRANRFRRTFF